MGLLDKKKLVIPCLIIGGLLGGCGLYVVYDKVTNTKDAELEEFVVESTKAELDFENKTASDMRNFYNAQGQEFIKKMYPTSIASDFALLNVGKSIEKELSDIKFTTASNKEMKLSDLKGKKIILSFALTSCDNCQEELEALSNYDFKDNIFLHVFPVNTTSEVSYMYKQNKGNYNEDRIVSITGLNGFELTDVSLTNVPSKIFINEEGIVTYTCVSGSSDKETLDLHMDRAFGDGEKMLDYLKTTTELKDENGNTEIKKSEQ